MYFIIQVLTDKTTELQDPEINLLLVSSRLSNYISS